MKEGWTYKKLGEVCDFEGGSQPPKSEWIKHPQEGYVRMLQIRDFTKSRNFEIEYVKLTKKLRLCNADDILIGRYGASVGKILTGLTGAYNVAIIKSIPDEKMISKSYIRRYFESSLFQNILFKVCASRAAQAGFSKDDISDTLIPVPPLYEQQQIVSRLDAAFAKIDALKANAERQLAEARALFNRALTEEMTPKEGWEEKTLGEVCIKSKNIKWDTIDEDKSFIYIDLTSVDRTDLQIHNPQIINKHNAPSRAKQIVKTGDVIFATTRPTLRRVSLIDEQFDSNICSTGFCVLRPGKDVVSEWIFYALQEVSFYYYIEPLQAGANYPAVTDSDVKNYAIPIPPITNQHSIVTRLDALSANVRKLEELQRKILLECDALKQSLLKEIFI